MVKELFTSLAQDTGRQLKLEIEPVPSSCSCLPAYPDTGCYFYRS